MLTPSRLPCAGVTDYLAQRGATVALKDYAGMLQALPCRTPIAAALAFCDALEPRVAWRDAAGYGHFRHFSRLLLQEFLTEAEASVQRVASRPAEALAAAGQALLYLRAQELPKGGQLALSCVRPGIDLGALAKEQLNKGDTILLSAMAQQQQPYGMPYQGAAASFSGAPPPPFPSGPTPEAVEAEVLTVVPQLTVRVASAGGGGGSSLSALCGGGVVLRADKLANRVTAARQLDALRAFADADEGTDKSPCVDAAIRALVCGSPGDDAAALAAAPPVALPAHLVPRRAAVAAHAAALPGVNVSQRLALAAGLNRTLTLVQGPPGTGKTATACTLVRLWLASGLGPVLATSDSNVAVDNLVAGLARAGCRVLRVGRPESVRPDLLQFSLEHASGAVPLPGSAAAQQQPLPRDEQHRRMRDALKRAEVVCATCSGAGSDMLEKSSFPAVLIDEAAQATEPAALVPLCRGARVVALVGDHAQLPPTVLCRPADGSPGLAVSLFDRLARAGVPPLLLDVQYRMHPALAHFPSRAFYGGALRSGTRAAHRPPPSGFPWPARYVPLAFLPCDGAERSEGTSHVNAAEADAVAAICRGLLSTGELSASDIGVVTPYAAQVRVLRRALAPMRGPSAPGAPPALEVASVDGFQGREKEVIVFSAVRASASGGVGFLADPRRLNVMLTRAKRGLVVVGHWRTLAGERSFWGPWLEWAHDAGLVVGAPPRDVVKAAAVAAMEACARALAEAGDVAAAAAARVAGAGAYAPPEVVEASPPRRRSRSRSRSRSRRKRSYSPSRSRSRSRRRRRSRDRSDSRSRSRSRKKHKSKKHKKEKSRHRRSRSRERRRSRSRRRDTPPADAVVPADLQAERVAAPEAAPALAPPADAHANV
jgi:hypothetical protein